MPRQVIPTCPWVRQLLDLRGPSPSCSTEPDEIVTVTIQLDAGQQNAVEYNGIDLNVSAGDTILRVVADVALETSTHAGWRAGR